MTFALLTHAEWQAIALSLRVAVCAVALSAIPGIALAWLLARKQFPGKIVLEAVVYLPLVLPPVAVGYLLLIALGRRSAIGSLLEDVFGVRLSFAWQGAVIAGAVVGFPLLVRGARLAFESVDERLEQAAKTLGTSRWRVMAAVTLPLALPGVLTGMILAFARSLGEFGATITFAGNIQGETRTLPSALYTAMQQPGGDAIALRLTVLSIVVALAALIASELLARRVYRRLSA